MNVITKEMYIKLYNDLKAKAKKEATERVERGESIKKTFVMTGSLELSDDVRVGYCFLPSVENAIKGDIAKYIDWCSLTISSKATLADFKNSIEN